MNSKKSLDLTIVLINIFVNGNYYNSLLSAYLNVLLYGCVCMYIEYMYMRVRHVQSDTLNDSQQNRIYPNIHM